MAVLRPPTPVVLSPSPPPSAPQREPTPSNPNATWVPKSERAATTPLDYVDELEQEEPDESILPTESLPASSNPKAVWVPKPEQHALARQQQNQVLPIEPADPQGRRASDRRRLRDGVAGAHFKGVLPRIATPPEPAPIALPEYRRELHQPAPSLPSDLDLQVLPIEPADPKGGKSGGLPRRASAVAGSHFKVLPSYVSRKLQVQNRAVPILLTISCLLFLVATSLLASLFLSKGHEPLTKLTLTAMPKSGLRANDPFTLSGTGFGTGDLLTFSRDNKITILDGNHKPLQAHADKIGNFTVQIIVASSWEPGPHTIHVADDAQQLAASTQITIEAPSAVPPKLQLRLSNLSIDFGAGDPGVASKKTITLTNAGGGQVTWQASSDRSWLAVDPSKGTFSGSAAVDLIVNRGAQPPGPYTGHVTFTQQGSNALSLNLSVTMSIKAAKAPAASLVLSTASLSYTGSTAQNPLPQTITLLNSGGQPLDWNATATTGNGAPWLSITPNGGRLGVNTATLVEVSIRSQQLAVGSYSGTISFQGGANPQVSVTLNVVAPANLAVSSTTLNLQAAHGKKSAGQLTIQDSGGQSLDWIVNTTTSDGTNWLAVSPTNGHLNPGGTQIIAVTANAGTLAVNSYHGTLTFTYGTSSRGQIYRAPVMVGLSVSLPPMPGISVQPSTLVFNTTQGINPSAQSFTITNIGNAPLNWAITKDANGTTYAATSVNSSTSSLAPSKSVTITVTPKVSSAGPGTIPAFITIFDSDKGSTVPQQQVSVTINITSAAIINASPGNMVFNQSSTITSSEELLSIDNTGSAPLNWSLAQGSQTPVSWLSLNTTSGTIAPGTTFTVNVTCDSSQLSPGTYTATLVVSDSDPNSPVLPQTITVTLVVGS